MPNNFSSGEIDASELPPYEDALANEFRAASENAKAEGIRRADLVREYSRLESEGMPQKRIIELLRDQFGPGVSRATLWRHRDKVEGQPSRLWPAILLPSWKGKTARANFSPAVWEYIQDQYLIQSKPSLKQVYRRAKRYAHEQGLAIPSYDAVLARIKELDRNYVVYKRNGTKALERTFPHQQRIYSALEINEIWCTDGHKADVFVRDKEGAPYRPIIIAYQDIRSRKILGWAIGKSETAALARKALHRAIVATGKILPGKCLMDNGMAFAAKENTGGARTRYRFTVKEGDLPGIFTMLGIEPIWALPGKGSSKPIERAWQCVTEMAKRKEFEGAYCGNSPDEKPENFDPKKAVPLSLFSQILTVTFEDYNARPHRGEGMHGNPPNQLYSELLSNSTQRQVTENQLKTCLLAVEPVRLHKENGSFEVLKNRYWSEKCSTLARVEGYAAHYNPDDATMPVLLSLHGKFICEAALIEKTGFANQDAAREHAKKKQAFMKAVKNQNHARNALLRLETGEFTLTDEEPKSNSSPTHAPKVVQLVQMPLQPPQRRNSATDDDDEELLSQEEFTALLVKKYSQKGE